MKRQRNAGSSYFSRNACRPWGNAEVPSEGQAAPEDKVCGSVAVLPRLKKASASGEHDLGQLFTPEPQHGPEIRLMVSNSMSSMSWRRIQALLWAWINLDRHVHPCKLIPRKYAVYPKRRLDSC